LEKSSALIARRAWNDGCWRLHSGSEEEIGKGYDSDAQAFVAGQNIGAITSLVPAGDIVREMTETAARILVTNAGAVITGGARL